MTLHIAALDDHTLVRLEGELTIYEGPALREALASAVRNGKPIMLDVDQVTEVDSAGVQILISARKSAFDLGIPLTLRCTSEPVLAFLDLCNLRSFLLTPGTVPAQEANVNKETS